jgi:uncharacterized repeat protein (TIGR01451 family)
MGISGIERCAGAPRRIAAGTLCAVAACVAASPAQSAGTPAGTNVQNVATATYGAPGSEQTVTSNTVTLKVDELLDVTVASADPGDVTVTPGATNQVTRFTITNSGNGNEAFTLTALGNGGGDDFDPSITSLVLDTNGNGAYDAGVDTTYVAGSNDPALAADASIVVFILSTIPSSATDGNRGRVDLLAAAKTGSGTPGTSFSGLGTGGSNAVVGASGADGTDDGYYAVASTSLAFTKSASVLDPFGGSNAVPGSTITYTLTATVSGSGSLPNVRVTDPIPSGSTYAPGSITLDGTGLTDAADGDAGAKNASAIAVNLGTVAAGTSRIITFKVTVN